MAKFCTKYGKAFFLFLMIILLLPQTIAQGKQAVPVEVTKVKMADVIQEVPVTGTIRSMYSSRISSSVEGLIEKMHVEVGDLVKKGSILVDLDSELTELELKSAQIFAKEAAERLVEARRRYLEADSLSQNRNIPQTEVEAREAVLRIAKITLQRRKVEEQHQKALLVRHQIKAPFSGVIRQRNAEMGEWVSPGDTLVELVDLENLRVDFSVPQEYYAKLTKKTPVKIKLPTGDKYYQGHIETIVAVSNASRRTFLLRTQIDEPVKITPGMSARGILHISAGAKSTVVSRDAITRYPSGRVAVWLVQSKGSQRVVKERRVRVGISFADKIEIVDGLQADDIVVVRGNNALQDGQSIFIKDFPN